MPRPRSGKPWRTIQRGYLCLHWFEGPTWRDARGFLRRRLRTKFYHRHVWEEANGPIPDGYVIHHRDGNPLNNDLGNLACLTVGEHTQLHRRASALARVRDGKKCCTRCESWKPLADFAPRERGVGGRSPVCRVCHRAAERARWRREHPDSGPLARPSFRGDGEKRCAACETWKPLSAFNRTKTRTAGWAVYCRDCAHAKWNAWYRRQREARRANQ